MEKFLLMLVIVSSITTLTTEAEKKLLDEAGKRYNSNILAAITSVALSILVGIGYVIIMEMKVTPTTLVYGFALVFLSFLCATTEYDKVIRTIKDISIEKLK